MQTQTAIQIGRPMRKAMRVDAIAAMGPMIGPTPPNITLDQDDLIIALATVLACVVVALLLI